MAQLNADPAADALTLTAVPSQLAPQRRTQPIVRDRVWLAELERRAPMPCRESFGIASASSRI